MMVEPIDEHFLSELSLGELSLGELSLAELARWPPESERADHDLPAERVVAYFDAQLQSRHLDFASRWLRAQGQGFYTIGSAGHESNAAVAMALRPTEPALLHYRSGAFYAARAAQVEGSTPIRDVLLGMAAAAEDPISGGRHKVFGRRELNIIPQTSTIASHLPRAVGIAFAMGRAPAIGVETPWPDDSVVACSFGDASANHSTAVGALNMAAYCAHRGIPVPVLFVCEDNGLGISTKTPAGWLERSLSHYPGVDYSWADGSDVPQVLAVAQDAADRVRTSRRPAVIHLKTVRFMGHAGSDAELGYRTSADIQRDYARDPLLHTARHLISRGILTGAQVVERYEAMRERVMAAAASAGTSRRLSSSAEIMAPIAVRRSDAVARQVASLVATPAGSQPQTLAQSINATLAAVMAAVPESIVFGEDVAVKGGVYGLTRGLRKAFGAARVFDTLLDEQSILGTALGTAVAGMLPIPEIQYLAYLHNAEDQLRGEAATLSFFSNGQYRNGMVVRVAGLAYQRGFGGHFHNDNSLAVLRDIPGVVLAVPSHPAEAPGLLQTCVALAQEEGRVCVFLEPIARYHTRDLHEPGDEGWLALPGDRATGDQLGRVAMHGDGGDVLIVTFGNGVFLSLRAARQLAEGGIACTVLDLRWLAPLPEIELMQHVGRFERVLIVDETRRSGGVSESLTAVLVDHEYRGAVGRVTSRDSFIPLGAAAELVLLHEDDIIRAARALSSGANPSGRGAKVDDTPSQNL